MTLDTVTAALYAMPPSEFIVERDAQVGIAKRAGDDGLAAAIKRLRRPSTSAALLNALIRQRGDEIDELLAVGEGLRDAQTRGAGEDLRTLMRSRQQLTTKLARGAQQLAPDLGLQVTLAVQREIQETLIAALADPATEQALRSGCLTSALSYAGFGAAEHPRISDKPRQSRVRSGGSSSDPRAGEAKQRLREAEQRAERAEHDAAQRAEQLRERQGAVDRLDERLAELDDEVRHLKQARTLARRQLAAAKQRFQSLG